MSAFISLRSRKNLFLYTILLIYYPGFSQDEDAMAKMKHQDRLEASATNHLFTPDYPDGIYLTKEDFINQKPASLNSVTFKGLNHKPLDSISHNGFFYNTGSDKKLKNVFAVSYQGHLYFQIKAILKNRNKADRAQSSSFHNSFVRVILGVKIISTPRRSSSINGQREPPPTSVRPGVILMNDLKKEKGIV